MVHRLQTYNPIVLQIRAGHQERAVIQGLIADTHHDKLHIPLAKPDAFPIIHGYTFVQGCRGNEFPVTERHDLRPLNLQGVSCQRHSLATQAYGNGISHLALMQIGSCLRVEQWPHDGAGQIPPQ